MKPLNALCVRLSSAFDAALRGANGWTDRNEDRVMVENVRRRHDGPGKPPDPDTIASAIAYFRSFGKPDGWRGMKSVCFGAGMEVAQGWCILSDDRLLGVLLGLAQGQGEARKRVKCFRFLLSSYWGFSSAADDDNGRKGWLALRCWLDDRLDSIETDWQGEMVPEWFRILVDHRNLLRDAPCARYGPKLLAGDGSEFRAVVSGLGIPSDSWVREEALLAQIRATSDLGDEKFSDILPNLLKVVTGEAGLDCSKMLQLRCVSMLVSRYARIQCASEHPLLRDTAVSVIGNPWLHRESWDANVVDERGRPDDGAREMVFGWLKRSLIKDFFELLSEDGVGDSRRLDYWLRFEPFIGDMWFALGPTAMSRDNRGNFKDFFMRAKGRLHKLEASPADNNAFVMRMGDHLAVEFGATDNASYLFRCDNLPPILQNLLSSEESIEIPIYELKSKDCILRSPHQDSPSEMKSWEQKFDETICPILGKKPTARSAFVPQIESLLKTYAIDGEDRRSQGGAFFIYTDISHALFNTKIQDMGFRYRSPMGWWKE